MYAEEEEITGCWDWPQLSACIRDTDNDYLRAARNRGDHCIGLTCSFVPEALLQVRGLVPVRVYAHGVVGTEMADAYLSNVLCSYTRSLLQFAMEGRHEHLDGWVFSASCDHLRRLYDNLIHVNNPPFAHILDLPHKKTAEAVDWYETEVAGLAKRLAEHFGVDTGPAALNEAIALRNRAFAAMRAIGDLRRGNAPPLTGAEFHALMRIFSVIPNRDMLDLLPRIQADIESRGGIDDYRARLMVVGSEFDSADYLDAIESTGALVVADRYCTGSIPALEEIRVADPANPVRAIAEQKLTRTTCPRMMADFRHRVDEVLENVEKYKVDGVIVETMKFCDLWGIEASPLADSLRKAGVPVLRLEREYMLTGRGQLATRVQAFLEAMGR